MSSVGKYSKYNYLRGRFPLLTLAFYNSLCAPGIGVRVRVRVDVKFGSPLYEKWSIRPLATIDSSVVVTKVAQTLAIAVLYSI